MAERQLAALLTELKTSGAKLSYSDVAARLSQAKRLLLQLNALTPETTLTTTGAAQQQQQRQLRALARTTYEQGALASIRARDAEAFTRYVAQLRPFYELDNNNNNNNDDDDDGDSGAGAVAGGGDRNKVTGLYLLLLLTQGRYAEFHSELEALGAGGVDVEGDPYLGYPIRLERWLMEGSYDRVWRAMKQGEVPCEEFGVFSEILTFQIRSEIASCSERAYPSLPLSSTKSLLFLDSEGAVVEFARSRGWIIKDGHIYFPSAQDAAAEEGEQEKEMSQMVIENTLGYARQLETIV